IQYVNPRKVNGPRDCYQGDALQGVRRFVKIAGIPDLEKCIQDAKKEGHRLWQILYQESVDVRDRRGFIFC
ncbi:hypothetical protein KAS10_02335, partial [Candidatus Aerophobetes bacterium]|nr:hypothetical protein [Candidatus Aerophobetes bacterium]